MLTHAGHTQKIYYIWQIVLIIMIVAINKHSSKIKSWCLEMPNATYSDRYR